MKFLLLFFLIPAIAFSQKEIPIFKTDETGAIHIEEVITVDSISSKSLYSRVQFAIGKLFVSAKDVTQLKDDNNFQVIVKGTVPVKFNSLLGAQDAGVVSFMLTVQCKEGRYRYILQDFIHSSPGQKNGLGSGGDLNLEKPACGYWGMRKQVWHDIKLDFKNQMVVFIKDLKDTMQTSKSSNTDNW